MYVEASCVGVPTLRTLQIDHLAECANKYQTLHNGSEFQFCVHLDQGGKCFKMSKNKCWSYVLVH